MNTLGLLKAGQVVRYHNVPVRKQELSAHSWQVALILLDIYPQARKELIVYAMVHDCGEVYTGDIPAPYKKNNPKVAELIRIDEKTYLRDQLKVPVALFDEEERQALKIADILSGLYHTAHEIAGGNYNAIPIYDKLCVYFGQQRYFNQRSIDLKEEITSVLS